MEAAAPMVLPADTYPAEEHPHLPPPLVEAEPLPIASSGDLQMMPPSTGLPLARSSASSDEASALNPLLDSIPQLSQHESPGDFPERAIHAPLRVEEAQADHHG